METTGALLRRKLASTRRWWRTSRAMSGIMWGVSVVIVLALICFHCDRSLTLSAHARELWRLFIGVAGGLTVIGALLATILKRLPDMKLAADVERRYPVLHERLLTTLDLAPAMNAFGSSGGAGSPRPTSFSPALTDSLAKDTDRVAVDLPFWRAVNLRPLRNGALTMLFTLLLLGAHVMVAGPAFANWLHRMADPHADIAPYAHTRVQIVTDKSFLPVGEGASVTIKTWGDAAERAELRVHQEGEPAETFTKLVLTNPTPVPAGHGNADERNVRSFRYHFSSLPHGVSLIAYANDGRSNERDIHVAARPTLLNVTLKLHYPAYMHRADKTLTEPNGSFAAPFGTEASVVATANNPLKRVTFIHDNAERGTWKVEGNKTFGSLSVLKDSTYSLKMVDSHGFNNLEVPKYVIHAERDQAPSVQISRPATDIDLVPNGSLPLIARATDDYGVVSMHLIFDKTHDDNSQVGNARLKKTGSGVFDLSGPTGAPQALVEQRWHIASVAPKPGDIVRYEVDAIDNDTLDGPHVGHSLAYRVHVVSIPEMQIRVKMQLDEEQRALQQLREHQLEAQRQVEQARVKQDPKLAAKAQETQRAVAQETQSLTERMQQLSNQLENNELATHSELTRRDEARQTLQNDAQQKMPAAANEVQKAQNAQTNKNDRSQALAQADQKQTDIKRDIDKAQQLLERTATPDQLAKEADRLAKDQQRLADSARSLAEDIKSQQQQSHSKEMTPEEKTGLEMERRQQQQVNADTQRLQQQLNQAAQAAQERNDQKTAQDLKRAAEQLHQGDVNGNQQQAQKNLDQNNPQNAAKPQDQAANALQKAAEQAQKAAGQNTQDTPKSAADKLEQAVQDLHKLAQQQQQVADQAGQHPNAEQNKALAQKENDIQQQANQAQQQLNGSKSAQQSVQNAQQNINQSSQQLNQNNSQAAKSPADKAAQQLENASKQAAQAAEQLRQQQAAQELADQVERLAQVQRGLQTETQRLEKAHQDGKLSSNDMLGRRKVAERQANTEKQVKDLASKFPSPAFQQAMKMAAQQMHPATENLGHDEPNTGAETQAAQGHATQTLETITRALKQQAQGGNQNQQQGQQGEQQQGSPQQAEAAEALGELMLGQGLQQQVHQDTKALDQARRHEDNRNLTPDQMRESNRLTDGQRAAQHITEKAAEHLQEAAPDAARAAQEATQHMDKAGQRLSDQHTNQPTQEHQQQALKNLDQAVQQAQQAMQQQQQQAQAQAQAQQGAPQPGQQKGNQPQRQAFTRLEKVQNGAMSAPTVRDGKGFSLLSSRDQRVLHEGQNDKVPAEYQDAVNRYFKSLAEKKR